MPIVIYTKTDKQIVCRGERLTLFQRLLLFFRIPLTLRAFMTDDRFWVPRHIISHVQMLTDADAAKRKADAEEAARNQPKIVRPAMTVPGQRH
jgi:hypothetical protein